MQIRIKATGRLESYLPEMSKVSGELSIPQNSTLQDVVTLLKIDADESFMCTINATMVPQSQLDNTILTKDDQIVLVPPIRGG